MSTHNPYASMPSPKGPESRPSFTLAHTQSLVRIQGLAILHGGFGLLVAAAFCALILGQLYTDEPVGLGLNVVAFFAVIALGAFALLGSCVGGLLKRSWGLWLGVFSDLFLLLLCVPMPLGLWGLWVHLRTDSRAVMVPESTRSGWRPHLPSMVVGATLIGLSLCWSVVVYVFFHM